MDFSAHRSEIVALTGPNSRLVRKYLRYMAALELPPEGEVEIMGSAAAKLDRLAFKELRSRIGYLIGGGSLLPIYNGLTNVMLPALYHCRKQSFRGVSNAARSLLAELGCEADALAMPHEMSALRQRQVQLARALMLFPDILCLEDPFHGLTADDRRSFGEHLLNVQHKIQTGCIVLETEYLEFVRKAAARIVFLGSRFVEEFPGWEAFVAARNPELTQYREKRL